MARGWESKSVEGQIELLEAEKTEKSKAQRSASENETLRKRNLLLLSRTRVLSEIEASRNERYTAQLKQALADLDAQLAQLDPST